MLKLTAVSVETERKKAICTAFSIHRLSRVHVLSKKFHDRPALVASTWVTGYVTDKNIFLGA